MRVLCAMTLAALGAAGLFAGVQGGRAEYIGGTLPNLENRVDGNLDTTGDRALVFRSKDLDILVPYQRVNLLEYGQKVDRRYAMAIVISPLLLLSKKRKHFLTVGYTDDEGRQQAMVFRVDKDDIRALLASLEARTGLRVQYQDSEARKAGKG